MTKDEIEPFTSLTVYFKSQSFYSLPRERERENQDFLKESEEFNTITSSYSIFAGFDIGIYLL
ncbi:MAG: hypothetical protein WCF03_13845 [Nitrososphaeraceae archaeon]